MNTAAPKTSPDAALGNLMAAALDVPAAPEQPAMPDDTLARTGNTARDQEMYAAGIRTGEENTKHNAAIRAAAARGVSTAGNPQPARDWELTCHECDGSGHVYVKHQVAERQSDVQEFKEECECCEGRGFVFAFQDIPGIEEYVKACRPAPAAGDALELKRKTDLIAELSKIIHNMTVAQQAAWIEWQHGAGAEAGMQWIENGLAGPGQIPGEDEPYGTEAQAYFDANQADPFPTCHCGRPSNILHMGNGYCSEEHCRAAIAAQRKGGA